MNHASTLGRARLSFASSQDVDEFVDVLQKYERGEISADEWRAFRLLRGTYGQRQDDASMLRVKIPQGILDAAQLNALAEVAERYSRGFGHITTRQNIQLHFLALHDVEPAMRRLAEVGLTTREACGNSVRNVTACVHAGVARDEAFDVTPYAEALSRYFLRHPLGSGLPRKFKVAWEGCATDHVVLGIHDMGWRARVVDGRRGFRVTVGGGTATLCRSGQVLFDFLPAADVLRVAEAILMVFQALGDYRRKYRNRLKFLIRDLGWERFREAFERALETSGAALPFDPEHPPEELPPLGPRLAPPAVEDLAGRAHPTKGPGIHPEIHPAGEYARWHRSNVCPQKQAGWAMVTATVVLGDVTATQMRALGDLARAYGDGTIRISSEQDLVFRWVPTADVPHLYRRLAAIGLGLPDANTVADVTSCPGAESCKLAVTRSRGLGRLLGDFLRGRPDLVDAAPDLQIKMSGCPNGCGRHHVAGIGFQGSVRKVDGRPVPQYFLLVGGAAHDDGARFGRLAAKLPARRIPEALERLIALYRSERLERESATDFFGRVELARVKETVADLERLAPEDAQPEDFVDLGERTEFIVQTMEGECSA